MAPFFLHVSLHSHKPKHFRFTLCFPHPGLGSLFLQEIFIYLREEGYLKTKIWLDINITPTYLLLSLFLLLCISLFVMYDASMFMPVIAIQNYSLPFIHVANPLFNHKKTWLLLCSAYIVIYSGLIYTEGFPGSSVGKESTCSVGDLGSIPELGRSPGEKKGYPLQYSRASLLAQLVKNPPVVWETWV